MYSISLFYLFFSMANPHYLSNEFFADYTSVIDGDTFFPVEFWPQGMHYKWRCSNLGYSHRIYITAFAYINDLDVQLLVNSLRYCNSFCTQAKLRKIVDIYDWLNHEVFGYERRSRYYSYCLGHRMVHDLNHRDFVPRNGSQPPRQQFFPGMQQRFRGLYHC